MSFEPQALFDLLPVILRLRDMERTAVSPGLLLPSERAALADLLAKVAAHIALTAAEQQQLTQLQQRALAGPSASLLAVIGEQFATLQEDLDQLYDDLFVETCADWVVPYIGDLIGYRALNGVTAAVASPRAEVAHTISYRRRKGTITMLEQLARDVTGWNGTAVEYFQHLVVTQYMNHIRPQCLAAPDFRQWEPLEREGSAFDSIMRSIDVRKIASGRGRFNIPNIGLVLWRIDAFPLSRSPAAALDAQRWRFHPLGIDQPLYTRPVTIGTVAHLSTPLNVPEPISRRVLDARLDDYYTGADNVRKSLRLYVGPAGALDPVAPDAICVCNLSDDGAGWAHLPPAGKYAVDPVLGRIALPPGLPAGTMVEADFHYGFSAQMGGGEYERAASFADTATPPQTLHVPTDHPTIAAALAALGGAGVIEIADSGRYEETLSIAAAANQTVELRAADKQRPTLVLGGPLALSGGAGATVKLNGLLIAGQPVTVADSGGNALAALDIRHCTLVPGLSLAADSTPLSPGAPSLTVALAEVAVTIDHSIVGGVRAQPEATVTASDSIIDANAIDGVAYSDMDGAGAGGALSLTACTVMGKIHALKLPLVSNSILLARLKPGDSWTAPVLAARRQEGCIRFSYIPDGARMPRRYQCLPESAASPKLALPRFTTLRYGFAGYAQLATGAGAALQTGADDQGQPGAFHELYQPQRQTDLTVRLGEYLRTSLEAGIFYDS